MEQFFQKHSVLISFKRHYQLTLFDPLTFKHLFIISKQSWIETSLWKVFKYSTKPTKNPRLEVVLAEAKPATNLCKQYFKFFLKSGSSFCRFKCEINLKAASIRTPSFFSLNFQKSSKLDLDPFFSVVIFTNSNFSVFFAKNY
jgi:hypothetical protein